MINYKNVDKYQVHIFLILHFSLCNIKTATNWHPLIYFWGCVTHTFTVLSKSPVKIFPKSRYSEPACHQTQISVEKSIVGWPWGLNPNHGIVCSGGGMRWKHDGGVVQRWKEMDTVCANFSQLRIFFPCVVLPFLWNFWHFSTSCTILSIFGTDFVC